MRIAQANFDIATLEVDAPTRRPLPTLDLVASYNRPTQGGARRIDAASISPATRGRPIGVQLNVPIYHGRLVDSRVRQAIALQDKRGRISRPRGARAFTPRRPASPASTARRARSRRSSRRCCRRESRYESNMLGQEVGVRTNLDVLNVQQNVFSDAARPGAGVLQLPASAVLRLKAAVGTLDRQDLEEINRRLSG